jgi:hypothetical protein
MPSCKTAVAGQEPDMDYRKLTPTTKQIQRMFSLAERRTLTLAGRTIEGLQSQLTDLQRQVLRLLGVPHHLTGSPSNKVGGSYLRRSLSTKCGM